jgi:hypothetical protein
VETASGCAAEASRASAASFRTAATLAAEGEANSSALMEYNFTRIDLAVQARFPFAGASISS